MYEEWLEETTLEKYIEEDKFINLLGTIALIKEKISLPHLKKLTGDKGIKKMFDCIKRFCREFDEKGKKYYTYHHDSFREFILDLEKNEYINFENEDIVKIHKKICDYIKQDYQDAQEDSWRRDYNYDHLTEHYYDIWRITKDKKDAQQVFDTVSPERRWGKLRTEGNDFSFQENDLRYAIKTSLDLKKQGEFELIKYCYVNSLLVSIHENIPIEVIEALIEMGQVKRAMGIARMFKGTKKVEALMLLSTYFCERGKGMEGKKIFEEAIVVTQDIKDSNEKMRLLENIATELAKNKYFDKAIEIAGDT